MPNSTLERRCVQPGLFVVDFPGVKVKNHGCGVTSTPLTDRPEREPSWELPKIIPTGEWDVVSGDGSGRNGEFPNITGGGVALVRESPPGFMAEPTPDQCNTGIILKSAFRKDVHGPKVLRMKPSVGKSVTHDVPSRRSFDGLSGSQKIIPKFFVGHLSDAAVKVSFARNLMPTFGDFSDHFGITIRQPSQDKKCGFDAVGIEQVKNPSAVQFQSRFKPMPLTALDQLVEGTDLKIIFESDRHDVSRGRSRCRTGHERGLELSFGFIQDNGFFHRGHYYFVSAKYGRLI
jgi:hypothetical protein